MSISDVHDDVLTSARHACITEALSWMQCEVMTCLCSDPCSPPCSATQVGMRDPIDRAASCMFYFYRGAMDGVLEMTEEEFRRVALECTACNNVAAAMLMSDLPGIGNMTVNRASLNASLSEAVFASALGNLERCVIVDHMDVSHGQIWAAWAPMFLTTWFPWVSSTGNTSIPHNNTNPQPYRLPYRLMKVLEDLNNLDVRLYNRGTELMLLQLETARARGFHKRHGKGARTEAADPEPEADHCPGATPELQDMIDNNERILSKHGVSRRILSNL